MTTARQQEFPDRGEQARKLVLRLSEELQRGRLLIVGISDENYCDRGSAAGSIGSHIRHNVDFVDCLVRGLANGKVDYAARGRDERVETDKEYAAERISRSALELLEMAAAFEGAEVLVRSEIDDSMWHRSSLKRELEFLHSHTVHHHALIAEKLRAQGIEPPEGFGVAPSTLVFWKSRADG
jgi:hypothetical protein